MQEAASKTLMKLATITAIDKHIMLPSAPLRQSEAESVEKLGNLYSPCLGQSPRIHTNYLRGRPTERRPLLTHDPSLFKMFGRFHQVWSVH